MADPLNRSERAIRALVVEDDPSWQQILSEILTDAGLDVDQANSYEEAVERARKQPHRLAVLDLSLGGTDHHNQDGLRTAEAVKRYDPGCVVLFLTGFATVELAVQVMQEFGAFTCLRKETFRRAKFRKTIQQALTLAPHMDAGPTADPGSQRKNASAPALPADTVLKAPALALIVEDDAGWRGLLVELLEDAGCQVYASSSYVEAIGLLKRERFNLAVVDLSLASSLNRENMDGLRLLASLRKTDAPVIVVSGFADPGQIEQAFQEQLIFACLEKQSFDRKSFRKTVQSALSHTPAAPLLNTLTDREREVLTLLARGLTNKEIAYQLTITPNTVKRHLKSLFVKLDVNTRAAASAKAISLGLGDTK